MTRVLLINQDRIPHYRVAVYNYLSDFLYRNEFKLTVVSGGVQGGADHTIRFDYREIQLSFLNLAKFIYRENPGVILFWVNLKNTYLFPTLLISKVFGKKIIYWGHGRDLLDQNSKIKNVAFAFEHWICDAIILYAEHIKKYVPKKFHNKVFIANNTLNMTEFHYNLLSKDVIFKKYNIKTKKNIIYVGRIQKRRRLHDLLMAFERMNKQDIGLILVGPDEDGILQGSNGNNIYKLGPIYGEDKFALLSASDVYCLPGAVGLSIVDAFYCGLPMVTEDVDESPEIMYLKDGINGFVVPKGDIQKLAEKLSLLIEDDGLRERFSRLAKNEIMSNGHIDLMCKGFTEALRFCIGTDQTRKRIGTQKTQDV